MSDARNSYHHGDLRAALIEAGLELAREGGPDAVALREITRSVGVTPNAAYRHFADRKALIVAVANQAQEKLATCLREWRDAAGLSSDPGQRALERLRGVGLGYIHFARTEQGWFELAFLTQDEPRDDAPIVSVADRVPPAFQLLLDALDDAVETGALAPERRQAAEWVCWSGVHGFADIATRGPLQSQDPSVVDALAEHIVDTIILGVKTTTTER